MRPSRRTEEREVRAADPALSKEANVRLTRDLQDAVGAERVRVPAGRPHVSVARHTRRSPLRQTLIRYRLPVAMALLVLLVVAGIVSFATDSLWALPLAIVLHAVGTFVVLGMAVLTTEVEHATPETAAVLEDDGVADPDALLTAMVHEYASEEGSQQARDTATQAGALTPAARPTEPYGERPVLGWLPPFVVGGAVLVAGTAPLVVDEGWMWEAPALVWPAAIIWALLSREVPRRAGSE